jgi:hypothetical protein
MTAYLAGIVQVRCEEHERASEIDGIMRAVLAALAYPLPRDGRRHSWTSIPTMVRRTGFKRTAVIEALGRLVEMGLIKIVAERPGRSTVYEMALLSDSEPVRETDARQTGDPSARRTAPVRETDPTRPPDGHESESSVGPSRARKTDDDSPNRGETGPHNRSADYSAVTRAALAPREAFAGPLVTGWAVRHDQAARHFRDYDGRMIECETFGPRSTFDLSMAPPLTLGHEKTATVVGKYVRHRNTGGGLWITWQLASDLPDELRARLGDPIVRPQLSMAFGDGPRVEWDEYGDGRISRMWTGTVTVSHVAIVPRGAYWNTDLDLVREFV